MVTIANPLDYHTFVWGNREKQTTAFTAMMKGDYALNLIVLDFPRQDRCDAADWMTTCDAVIASAKATGAVAGIVASLGENMPEEDGALADVSRRRPILRHRRSAGRRRDRRRHRRSLGEAAPAAALSAAASRGRDRHDQRK